MRNQRLGEGPGAGLNQGRNGGLLGVQACTVPSASRCLPEEGSGVQSVVPLVFDQCLVHTSVRFIPIGTGRKLIKEVREQESSQLQFSYPKPALEGRRDSGEYVSRRQEGLGIRPQ